MPRSRGILAVGLALGCLLHTGLAVASLAGSSADTIGRAIDKILITSNE